MGDGRSALCIAVVFGFLWIREATREQRGAAGAEPAPAPPPSREAVAGRSRRRSRRKRFLEASTLGIGAAIGGLVTLPIAGLRGRCPPSSSQGYDEVDLGPLENFPEGEFVIDDLLFRRKTRGRRPAHGLRPLQRGDERHRRASRSSRTAAPTSAARRSRRAFPDDRRVEDVRPAVDVTPVASVSGFGCPCHGGAYDAEGNRTAGPPVRCLDRYQFSIKDGNLWLGTPYSVGTVDGTGADAVIHAYRVADPGVHVDGPEQIFYPYVPG